MKSLTVRAVPVLLAAILVACTHGNPGTPAQTNGSRPSAGQEEQKPAEQIASKEVPFDYASMTDSVLIRLDEEPSIHSPIHTVVTPEPQTYRLFFREAMDRASVETALRNQAEQATREGTYFTMPTFSFNWHSDRQLVLEVKVPASTEPDYGSRSYLLDVTGASTQNGDVLKEAPNLMATLYSPSQLWKVSVDGKTSEQLTDFAQTFYQFQVLDNESRYLLLGRFKEYCECDKELELLQAVYDIQEKTLEPYPVRLTTHYIGEGTFIADRRGFFYTKPAAGAKVPASQTAVEISVNGYVHGANFSKDHSRVIMAVGAKEQQTDLDLVEYTLDTGREHRLLQALKGRVRLDELSGTEIGVSFIDDGTNVYFAMQNQATHEEIRYAYDWKTQSLKEWNPPVDPLSWSGLIQSSDRLYQMYPNAGLYKGGEKISDLQGDGHWLNGTHLFVYSEFEPGPDGQPPRRQINLLDADNLQTRTIAKGLHPAAVVVGGSADGKWVYVQTVGSISPHLSQ